MRPAFFVKQLLLLLAGFVAINLLSALRSGRTVPRLLLHVIDTSPPVTDLFVGNSLMAAGLDVPAYEHAAGPGGRAVNAGLGSSEPVEHDLLLRRALRTTPGRVFYGFFDTQLTDRPIASFRDLAGNRGIVHYLYRETAIHFLCPDDPVTAWRIRLVSFLPLVYERLTTWSKVELLRRRLGEIGLPVQATNAFGRAADFSLLEADDTARFARKCGGLAQTGAGFSAPVADMPVQAHDHGAAFCFVEMPMPSAHRRRFYATPEWSAYEAALHRRMEQCGARFVNATDWVGDDGFHDPLHLNDRGAAAFSLRLATAP